MYIHIYVHEVCCYLGCIPHNKFMSSGTVVFHYQLKFSHCKSQTSEFGSTAQSEHSFLRQERLGYIKAITPFYPSGFDCLAL